jgi:CBS domain-containing protein
MSSAILVRDHMSTDVIAMRPDTGILQAAHTLIAHGISGAPVVDGYGDLVGMLTERDFMRAVVEAGYHDCPTGLVEDFMSSNPLSVSPDDSVLEVARKFLEGRFHRYPVVDDGRVVGVISRRDVMRAMGTQCPVDTPGR